jgi:antagonist of KipI
VPTVLGSRSTLVSAGIGGFEGRALKPGDRLGVRPSVARLRLAPGWFAAPALAPRPQSEVTLRVIRGPQADWFSREAWEEFLTTSYRVNPLSDRMGARLDGSALRLPVPRDMVSEAVATGSVQVPPDGQPIVLLAERQTIGGYPKIADIISVDLGRVAQLRPGDRVRFVQTDIDEARRQRRAAERAITWLHQGIGQRE